MPARFSAARTEAICTHSGQIAALAVGRLCDDSGADPTMSGTRVTSPVRLHRAVCPAMFC
jgi:hypothetical protein